MSGILNPRSSNYAFRFPPDFFYDDVINKFNLYNQSIITGFRNINEYMTHCVQGINWPYITAEHAEQTFQEVNKRYKPGLPAERYIPHELNLTMKTTDGFLSYFIMQEQLIKYLDLGPSDEMFLPNLTLRVLDNFGLQTMAISFEDIVFLSLSEFDLSFTKNAFDYQTFTAGFQYKRVSFLSDLQ